MCGNVVTLKSTRQVEDAISLTGLCSCVRQCDWLLWGWPLYRLPVQWVGQDRLCRVLEGQPQGELEAALPHSDWACHLWCLSFLISETCWLVPDASSYHTVVGRL